VEEAQILLKDLRTRRGRGEAGEPGTANDEISVESDLLAAKAYELLDNPYYAARILAQTADDYPSAKNYYELRRRAAENFVAAGGHLAQAAAQYKALLVRVHREYPQVRAAIEPQALLALASIFRHQNRQETLLEAQKHLDELERAHPQSPQAREAALERAEIYVAHALRAAPTGGARPRLMRNALDLLDNFAAKNPGTPLEVKAKIRKAELEEADGQPHLSLLTYMSIDAGALERGDPRGADQLRFDQVVRRMEQAAERPEALHLLRRMAGDPLVDSLLRAKAAFRVAICLRAMGESEAARKAFEEFVKLYGGEKSDVKGESAEATVKKLAQEAEWYSRTLKALIEQREKVAAARERLRGEDLPK
jgi:tetratricopeptide (TPR) repeat protein